MGTISTSVTSTVPLTVSGTHSSPLTITVVRLDVVAAVVGKIAAQLAASRGIAPGTTTGRPPGA
jgi:hypothetical protein